MDIWIFVLIFHYVTSAIGLIANMMYFKSVVMNKFYDIYWRISSFIISTAMFMVIFSHIVSSIICIAYDGSYFPSRHCGKNQLYFLMDYLNCIGEFSIAAGIFIMIFERYGCVWFPSIRLTAKYKSLFSGFIILYLIGLSIYIYLMRINLSPIAQLSGFFSVNLLYVLSFLVAVHLCFFSRKQYYKTIGQTSLKERYLLSESYELCQKCSVPTFCLLVINITLFISFWLFVMNIIPYEVMYQYFLLFDVTLNVSATLFPILFLNNCRRSRNRIDVKQGTNEVTGVRQLNGNTINTTQSQEEYFLQLQSAWT